MIGERGCSGNLALLEHIRALVFAAFSVLDGLMLRDYVQPTHARTPRTTHAHHGASRVLHTVLCCAQSGRTAEVDVEARLHKRS